MKYDKNKYIQNPNWSNLKFKLAENIKPNHTSRNID